MVSTGGLEPPRLSPHAPQACMSTIPSHRRLLYVNINKTLCILLAQSFVIFSKICIQEFQIFRCSHLHLQIPSNNPLLYLLLNYTFHPLCIFYAFRFFLLNNCPLQLQICRFHQSSNLRHMLLFLHLFLMV